MKLNGEPIFIDCIELGLKPGQWANNEIADLFHTCGVFEFDELDRVVVKYEIRSRMRDSNTEEETVLEVNKGQVLSKKSR